MSAPVGVIGLGNMGAPMVRRFLDVGLDCVVHDKDSDRVAKLVALGAQPATSPRAVGDACAIVIASLPSPDISRAVVLGDMGLAGGRAVRQFVETSTIGPSAARELAADLSAHHIGYVDAPVSGGPVAFENNSLTGIVSAAEADFQAVEPALKVFCANIFRIGDQPGQAQACKLVNNAMSLSILAIACEAAVFGVASGLDPHAMIDVVNKSSGRSAVTETKFLKHILKRRFDFGGALSTGAKDLALFVAEARKINSPAILAPVAGQIWRQAGVDSDPGRDVMELIKWFEKPLGVVVGTPE